MSLSLPHHINAFLLHPPILVPTGSSAISSSNLFATLVPI
ncbi:hypothetical protein AZE42_08892 [Rhizopogon vesiculosus]|uniref:Uncharacterized protein n=1 Tax=Rhizopogon vesiculosus TaxID=180088 RepID=A0A1J8PL90_9AGAM|nr:hypothetical protein AZE42_08892 [Rhizopogon vesiculosus]